MNEIKVKQLPMFLMGMAGLIVGGYKAGFGGATFGLVFALSISLILFPESELNGGF